MAKIDKENLKEILNEIQRLSSRLKELEERVVSMMEEPATADDDEPVDMSMEEVGGFDVDAVAEPLAAEEPVAEEPVAEDLLPEPEPAVEEPEPEPASEEPVLRRQPSSAPGLPWKRDTVGIRVKNIRSAISLMDRALFINILFKQDVVLYDKTIAELNALENFDDAVVYVEDHFPDWNLSSDAVYSFMMSVRKKLG
ncbi:MAG: hypothetical protein IKR69_07320 [Bacteroidales bacterium]|nr:hypothetical protein [Bacteroidales bacterium]